MTRKTKEQEGEKKYQELHMAYQGLIRDFNILRGNYDFVFQQSLEKDRIIAKLEEKVNGLENEIRRKDGELGVKNSVISSLTGRAFVSRKEENEFVEPDYHRAESVPSVEDGKAKRRARRNVDRNLRPKIDRRTAGSLEAAAAGAAADFAAAAEAAEASSQAASSGELLAPVNYGGVSLNERMEESGDRFTTNISAGRVVEADQAFASFSGISEEQVEELQELPLGQIPEFDIDKEIALQEATAKPVNPTMIVERKK